MLESEKIYLATELISANHKYQDYSAHYIDFGIMVYKNGQPWRQVSTETELHEIIEEEVNVDG